MTLSGISFAYLRARNLGTVLNVVLLAFGAAAITMLVLIGEQLGNRSHPAPRGVDLVVGEKGSALQSVLASVYRFEVPTGTVSWSEVQEIQALPQVSEAIPVAAGGMFQTYPLIGTTSRYYALYGGAKLRDGRFAEAPFEVVLGAEVARTSGLSTGATFTLPDANEPSREGRVYRVVGILWMTGTALDRLAVTDLVSVWPEPPPPDDSGGELVSEPAHDDGRYVNALLLRAEPGTAEALAREINARPELQAVSPARETARLPDVMTAGLRVLRGFALLLVIAAAFSVFIGLYGALSERRYDLAIMRALGASPGQLMALLLFEGVLLAAIGAAIGIALGHVATSALGFALRFERVGITGWMWSPHELWVLGGALLVGVLAALVPAWRAHETDIAKTLARG